MLYKKVHKAEEVKDLDFYAFSYYYDCAAEVGLIGTSVFILFHLKWQVLEQMVVMIHIAMLSWAVMGTAVHWSQVDIECYCISL